MDEQRDRAELFKRTVEQRLPAVAPGKVGGEEIDAVVGRRRRYYRDPVEDALLLRRDFAP